MTTTREVFYSGRVQGVGFRYAVKRLAAGYEVTGWVQNLPDGRVKLRAGGRVEEVEAFLAAVAASELAVHIREAVAHCVDPVGPPDPPATGFSIRR